MLARDVFLIYRSFLKKIAKVTVHNCIFSIEFKPNFLEVLSYPSGRMFLISESWSDIMTKTEEDLLTD